MAASKTKSLRCYSTEELSELLGGIPVETLKRWRKTGDGPKSLPMGKHRRYRECDIEEWLTSLAGTATA